MFCGSWSSILIVLFGAYVAYRHSTAKHKFAEFSIPPARPLDKSVPTLIVKEFELLAHGQSNGIESIAIVDGAIYATDQNCDAMKIENGRITQRFPMIKDKKCEGCCSALGIRHWHGSKFVMVDGVLGVLVLDFSKESVEQLYSSINLLGKHEVMFADDFDFIDNETIVFSDFAAGCPLSDLFICLYGGVKNSRLVQFNLRTRGAKVLLDDQLGLNGVQLHSDKQSVLVSQSLTSKVLRFYFAGSKQGRVEVFADGLPGFPDNIRPSSKGNTYWVAFFSSRAPGTRIIAQTLGPYPTLRGWLFSITQAIYPKLFDTILTMGGSNQHIFVELDTNGKVVGAVHDVDGHFPFTTQVTDDGTYLYFSSFAHDYVGKIKKK